MVSKYLEQQKKAREAQDLEAQMQKIQIKKEQPQRE